MEWPCFDPVTRKGSDTTRSSHRPPSCLQRRQTFGMAALGISTHRHSPPSPLSSLLLYRTCVPCHRGMDRSTFVLSAGGGPRRGGGVVERRPRGRGGQARRGGGDPPPAGVDPGNRGAPTRRTRGGSGAAAHRGEFDVRLQVDILYLSICFSLQIASSRQGSQFYAHPSAPTRLRSSLPRTRPNPCAERPLFCGRLRLTQSEWERGSRRAAKPLHNEQVLRACRRPPHNLSTGGRDHRRPQSREKR